MKYLTKCLRGLGGRSDRVDETSYYRCSESTGPLLGDELGGSWTRYHMCVIRPSDSASFTSTDVMTTTTEMTSHTVIMGCFIYRGPSY